MKKEIAVRTKIAIAIILLCYIPAFAVQFTADMIQVTKNRAIEGKIYVKQSKYRMELKEDGQDIIVLVDQDARITRVLVSAEKIYMEMASDDMQSLMNDPFQAAKYTETIGDKKKVGKEKISGYECNKYDFVYDDQVLMSVWVSAKLGFPLKIITPGEGGQTMELKNIKEISLKDELFTTPAGYTQIKEPKEPEIQLPEWAERIASAEIVKPPFKRTMSAEEMVRVKIESGKGVKVTGINNIERNSAFMAVPFKDGKPIKEPSMYLYNLSSEGQSWGNTFRLTPYEADEIVIRVKEGKIQLNVEHFDIGFVETVSAGKELKVPVVPGKNIDFRMVNIIGGESVCTATLAKGGNEVSDDVIGPKDYRTYTFKKEGESKKNTWSNSAGADEFIVRVEKGEVLVNVNQP